MPYHSTPLDLAFHALSDPTRRAVVSRLAEGEVPVTVLAEPFDMALPSFAQHLKVLEDCGLITSEKRGRSRWCRLHEVSLEGDSGEFFGTTLADYARVVPDVRRQFQRIRPETYRNVRGRLAQQNAFTAELIGGIRATRAFGRNAAVNARYAALNARTAASWRDTVFHFSLFFALVDLALRATTVGMLWFGGSAVLRGDLAVGQFVQFWFYFAMLSSPIV